MKPILAYRSQLAAEIQTSLTQARGSGPIGWQQDALDRLRPFAGSGKLLRGSLLCYAYEMYRQQPPDQSVLKVAAGLELIHSGLLIHDDIMDQDALRRGQPALHSQYQRLGKRRRLRDADHFGESMGVCVGDMALFCGFQSLAQAQLPTSINSAVSGLFNQILIQVCAGQMQDMYLEASPKLPTKAAIYEVMLAKTASYTLSLPLVAGALLAGQPDSSQQQLQRLGRHIGCLFQIRDDELGIRGNTATLGKPIGSDIKEGKKTLLYYHLMRQASLAEKQRFATIFGNPRASRRALDSVERAMEQRGVFAVIDREATRQSSAALRIIAGLQLTPKATSELQALVAFCGQRLA